MAQSSAKSFESGQDSASSSAQSKPLEIIREPGVGGQGRPILFVHGIFCGAWVWQEHFMPWFAAQGYDCWAVSLRGHGQSPGRERLNHLGVSDFVDDVERAIALVEQQSGQKPWVVGHSMGGLLVQKLMLRQSLPGAVLLCAIPPQGLIPLAWSCFWRRPDLTLNMARTFWDVETATPEQLREVMFHQPIEDETLNRYMALMGPESHRLGGDLVMGAPEVLWSHKRCPLAVIGAKEDQLVPKAMVDMTAWSYGVKVDWLDGMGHGVMLEQDWVLAAQALKAALERLGA